MRIDNVKLADKMAERCISVSELADKAGVKSGTISAILQGTTSRTNIQTAGKIIKVLDCSLKEIIARG